MDNNERFSFGPIPQNAQESEEQIRALLSTGEVHAWLKHVHGRIWEEASNDGQTEDNYRSWRRSLLGLLSLHSSHWDESLLSESLKMGGGNHAVWMGANPAIQGELTEVLIRWCRRAFLKDWQIQNKWVGNVFLMTERPNAFATLSALAARRAIPQNHWLLRWARVEARLLPGNHARREVLGAHPEDSPRDALRGLAYAEHENEEVNFLERILILSGREHSSSSKEATSGWDPALFAQNWRRLAAINLERAVSVLERSHPSAVRSLERADFLLLLEAKNSLIRERAMRLLGSVQSRETNALAPTQESPPKPKPLRR